MIVVECCVSKPLNEIKKIKIYFVFVHFKRMRTFPKPCNWQIYQNNFLQKLISSLILIKF